MRIFWEVFAWALGIFALMLVLFIVFAFSDCVWGILFNLKESI